MLNEAETRFPVAKNVKECNAKKRFKIGGHPEELRAYRHRLSAWREYTWYHFCFPKVKGACPVLGGRILDESLYCTVLGKRHREYNTE